MPINKKQVIRLVRLVGQLKENRYPNCAKFASELRKTDLEENLNVACTEKTVYRDIQVLKNDFDAPIKFDKSRNGYYLARHDWNFTCPEIFTDSEMLAAVLGARVAEHIFPEVMQTQIREAVDYLLTYNNPDFLDCTQIDSLIVIPANRSKIDSTVFLPLFYSWQRHEVCRISYLDSKGIATEREFEPHTLIFYNGVWYSKGYCRVRKEPRTFALPRMKSVVSTGVRFEPDLKIIKSANEQDLFDPEMASNVVVICDDYLAKLIQTRPLSVNQEVIDLPNGGCELRVSSMSRYQLITWTMQQCDRATVIEPEDIVCEINNITKLITSCHSNKENSLK